MRERKKILQICKEEQEIIIINNYNEDISAFEQGKLQMCREIEFAIQGHCTDLKQFENQAKKIWEGK